MEKELNLSVYDDKLLAIRTAAIAEMFLRELEITGKN